MVSRRLVSVLFSWRVAAAVPLAFATFSPGVAWAQSAADKATARELAVAGIKAYKKGDFTSALDKLQRAQALYDAHVHLVYIARCYAQLGQLVEASEAYRALARKPLPKDASAVVRNAQSEGAEELAALEPRIPKLRIEVEPAKVKDLTISINGVEVPAAIVGVDRPVNPGTVQVRVGAPGYKTGEATVDLAEGGKESVTVVLEKGEGGPAVVEGGAGQPGAEESKPAESTAVPEPHPKPVSFVITPRLSVLAPAGKIGDANANKVVRGGAGGELRFGVHFLRRFTGFALIEAHGLGPLSGFDSFALDGFQQSSAVSTATTDTVARVAGGLGFMYSTPHHQLGYFVGLDLIGEYMAGTTTLQIQAGQQNAVGFDQCSTDVMFSGGGARLHGGGVIPLSHLVALTPYVSLGASSFAEVVERGDCEEEVTMSLDSVHGWLGLGVGAQFYLGE